MPRKSNKKKTAAQGVSAEDRGEALLVACQMGRYEAVRRLHDGADVNYYSSTKDATPLLCACVFGRADVIRLLVEKGADANKAGYDNRLLPLDLVCSEGGRVDVVRLLLDNGADVTLATNALVQACVKGHVQVVRLLLEKGADPNLVKADADDGLRRTPLACACGHGHADVIRLLLEKDADVNQDLSHRMSPLVLVCDLGRVDLVRLLVEHGADVRRAGEALVVACGSGFVDVARVLLDEGANANYVLPLTGLDTPLSTAVHNGHLEIARLLLEDYGADVSKTTDQGSSALLTACTVRQVEAVRFLLERGADVDNRVRDCGLNPLEMALWNGSHDVRSFCSTTGPTSTTTETKAARCSSVRVSTGTSTQRAACWPTAPTSIVRTRPARLLSTQRLRPATSKR